MAKSLEEEWQSQRRCFGIQDTEEARVAFYCGGRAVLTLIIDASVDVALVDELEGDILRINDQLAAFPHEKSP